MWLELNSNILSATKYRQHRYNPKFSLAGVCIYTARDDKPYLNWLKNTLFNFAELSLVR